VGSPRLDEREFRFLDEMGRYDAFLRLYHSLDPADGELLETMYRSRDPLTPLILLQYLEELPEKRAVFPILEMIEEGNEVVSRAAMSAYRRNHYPGKPRLLKALVLSKSARACRFAVRVLSRAGFMDALPLILRELDLELDHWFTALKSISGEDPVPPESRGRLKEMRQHWIAWAGRKGIRW